MVASCEECGLWRKTGHLEGKVGTCKNVESKFFEIQRFYSGICVFFNRGV